jgi:acetyltransferase-like isoleucine patch superfamily enzyme
MITYNHEAFISEAIEGVLMQKTLFPIQLVIGEDCSTDNTRKICMKYKENYPNKIKLLMPNENLGIQQNFLYTFQECTGKYIALCEGDDYWTDPYKLQKQVDFLEANEDFAICFHDTFEHNKKNPLSNFYYCSNLNKDVFELKDLLYSNFIPTCSAVFRNTNIVQNLPLWVFKSPAGDWVLHILNAKEGKIKYINEVMGVHRIHDSGTWSKNSQIKNLRNVLSIYTLLYKNVKEIKSFKSDYKRGKSNIYKALEKEYLKNRQYLKSILCGLNYLVFNPESSIFNTKSILKLFYHALKRYISLKQNRNSFNYNEHIDIGLSFIQNTNFDFRKPVVGKKYVTIGDNCQLFCNFIFESSEGEVTIGNNVFIGGSNIICRSKITFGNNIFVAWGGYIYDHDSHSLDFRKRREDILQQLNDMRTGQPNFIYNKNWDAVNCSPITIKDDVWIGMNVTILKGVTIGEGSIVGAGSVVTKDVPPWSIVAGNPAKVVKELPTEFRKL